MEKLQFVELSEIYHLKTPKLGISLPQRDPEKYAKLLAKHFPGEKAGIRGFVREIVRIAWSNPGGGFAGVLISGQLAFRKMMEDWSRQI